MNQARLEEIVEAVLYEGYILYPYRASSKKNRRERFTFGRVYPERYSESQNGAEPCAMQTECLVKVGAEAAIKASVRFLQPMLREIGELVEPRTHWNGAEPEFRRVPELRTESELFQTWHEAVERRVDILPLVLKQGLENQPVNMPFSFHPTRHLQPIRNGNGQVVGVVIRRQPALTGSIELSAQPLEPGVFKVRVRILNQTAMSPVEQSDPDALLVRTMTSTHTILEVENGEFISLMDPGEPFKHAAKSCQNVGTWPVLVGDEEKGERTTMLSSPIILYDYPKIAPESAGSLFDGTEIDEILSLRLQTLTEEEKFEMRHVDEHARRVLERTETLPDEARLRMHGTMKSAEAGARIEFDDFFGANTRLDSVIVASVTLKPGARVRIRPKGRADVMDLALAGQTAIVEAVEQDLEKNIFLAVVFENDPGKDLGMMRQPGHRFFYSVDEVEPLVEELT